jgi:hypothetical protein
MGATAYSFLRTGDVETGAGGPGTESRESPPPVVSSGVPATVADSTTPAAPSPSGTWIAQLASVAFTEGDEGRVAILADVRHVIPDAQVLVSDDYDALRPGYWVVYHAGPFTSGRDALAFCDARGRTTKNSCIGRFLSDSISDRTRMCFRDDQGVLTEAC